MDKKEKTWLYVRFGFDVATAVCSTVWLAMVTVRPFIVRHVSKKYPDLNYDFSNETFIRNMYRSD
ncbi:MAG: hypothetical protein LUD27_02325 [Clostridia bacterium]|nr:hypothetical protein [Clostridia bacterium]